jgi:hypothetical protein
MPHQYFSSTPEPNNDKDHEINETDSPVSIAKNKNSKSISSNSRSNPKQQHQQDGNGSDDGNEEDEESPILFSCRCESARPVTTLLSCLRNVSLSNNAGSGPSLSSLQEATSNLLSTNSSNSNYNYNTNNTSSHRIASTSSGAFGKSKVQYATVFVSEKSITFQVHGIGKQSRATVDMQAGLFSEYYVAEQSIPMDDDDDDDDDDDGDDNNNNNQNPKMEIIKGGEFGINLTALLECLCVLGPNTLDRTTLCLSYDSQAAIFKIELLEQCYGGRAGVLHMGGGAGGGTNVGTIIASCAIPGMAVAEEDDDDDSDGDGNGYLTLDNAFRSHPILARTRIKSDFLKDAISELTDVSGSSCATIGISKSGLEFATFGHSTECHVVIPYVGNHPSTFVSLEGVMDTKTGSSSKMQNKCLHARNYPLHSLLSAMRGLEIASETCITINGNGMVAIQHQVLDKVGNGEPNYVDFIMCCLEGDYDDEEMDDENGAFTQSTIEHRANGYKNNGNQRTKSYDYTQESTASFIVEDPSQSQLQPSQNNINDHNNINEENDDNGADNYDDIEHADAYSNPTSSSQQAMSLFGTVANIGTISESFSSGRSKPPNQSFQQRRRRGEQSPRKRQVLSSRGQSEKDEDDDDVIEFEEEENSLLDITATIAVSSNNRRRSARGDKDDENPASSPQLMYGDTHLE